MGRRIGKDRKGSDRAPTQHTHTHTQTYTPSWHKKGGTVTDPSSPSSSSSTSSSWNSNKSRDAVEADPPPSDRNNDQQGGARPPAHTARLFSGASACSLLRCCSWASRWRPLPRRAQFPWPTTVGVKKRLEPPLFPFYASTEWGRERMADPMCLLPISPSRPVSSRRLSFSSFLSLDSPQKCNPDSP